MQHRAMFSATVRLSCCTAGGRVSPTPVRTSAAAAAETAPGRRIQSCRLDCASWATRSAGRSDG